MVIVISTMGSYGDFKPCLNLAKELISRGHKVRIITHKKYEPEAVENGLELFDNGCDLERFMKYVANITKYDDDNTDDDDDYSLEEYKDSIINATEKALDGADFLLYFGITAATSVLAEAKGIPYMKFVFVSDEPNWKTPIWTFPVKKYPLFGTALYNRLSYYDSDNGIYDTYIKPFSAWAKKLGINIRKIGRRKQNGDKIHVLCPCCTFLFNDDSNLKKRENYHYMGNWDTPVSDSEYIPDEALKEFIADEKPVFIGFGSVIDKESDSLKKVIIETAKRYKGKIILQSGWIGFTKSGLPENVFLVDYIPHEWLFRQVSGAVIHGGAGAVAYALKAGIPVFVVPFGTDQFYWGSKIHEKKCGPKPIPRTDITPELLLEGIYELEKPEYIKNAKKASEILALENGVAEASDIIEKYYKEYRTKNIGR